MNSSYLTKHLSKLSLVINLAITAMFWFYCIGASDPWLLNIIRVYLFVPVSYDAVKIIITAVCGIWTIRSITVYEARVIQFVQADLLKGILKELQSSRKLKQIDDMDAVKIDFDKVNR